MTDANDDFEQQRALLDELKELCERYPQPLPMGPGHVVDVEPHEKQKRKIIADLNDLAAAQLRRLGHRQQYIFTFDGNVQPGCACDDWNDAMRVAFHSAENTLSASTVSIRRVRAETTLALHFERSGDTWHLIGIERV